MCDKQCGVYGIGYEDQIYIGSSKNLNQRYKQHIDQLKRGKHHNYKLQKLYSEHKELSFEVLWNCSPDKRFEFEQVFVDYLENINIAKNVKINGAGMNKKEVHQYSLNGNYIKSFKSTRDAETEINIWHSNISAACSESNNTKSAGGFQWRYYKVDKLPEYNFNKSVMCFNKDGYLIEVFNSVREASRKMKVNAGSITNCAKERTRTGGGFIWKYKNIEYGKA